MGRFLHMTDDAVPDLTLRDRFLAGTCTPADLARIQALSVDDPERWQGLAELRAGFHERRHVAAPEWQEAWARWKKAERFSTARPPAGPLVGPLVGRRILGAGHARDWRSVAYALAGTTVIAIAVATVGLRSRGLTSHASGNVSTFATNATQQATVTLSDGTHVVLSPGTTLHSAGVDGRTVTLDSGEAYFDVATRASVPFTVRSGVTTTRVLGTAFLVRHDPHQAHVRVSVNEGKVSVTSERVRREELMITAGQIGDLTDSTTRLSALENLPAGMERKGDEVVFYHTPVESVLGVIGQWYGLQFRCADSTLLHRSVTIGLSTRSSAEMFSVLQELLEVNVAVRGDTVTLATRSPRPRTSSPRMQNYDSWSPTRETGR